MYSFRFNPVFNRWVVLGTPLPSALAVTSSNLILGGRDKDFLAAAHPRHPFIFDPQEKKRKPETQDRLYVDQPAVGEYELLLYQGKVPVGEWTDKEWVRWFGLVKQRIVALHHNPHLHNVFLSFSTAAVGSIEGYFRVGDLIATSHPVAGEVRLLSADLAEKVLAKEPLYVIHEDVHGQLRAPSAPLQAYELWYVPKAVHSGLEKLSAAETQAAAEALAASFRLLRSEYPSHAFTLRIHSSLAGEGEGRWWFQIYSPINEQLPLSVRPLPERLVKDLKFALNGTK